MKRDVDALLPDNERMYDFTHCGPSIDAERAVNVTPGAACRSISRSRE